MTASPRKAGEAVYLVIVTSRQEVASKCRGSNLTVVGFGPEMAGREWLFLCVPVPAHLARFLETWHGTADGHRLPRPATAECDGRLPWLNLSNYHHALSHAGDSDAKAQAELLKINNWYAE